MCIYIYAYIHTNMCIIWNVMDIKLNPMPFLPSPSVMADVNKTGCFNQVSNVQHPC